MRKNKKKIFLITAAVLSMMAITIISGCSTPQKPVAATIDNQSVYEQEITDRIDRVKVANNITTDEQWAQYLFQTSETPASIRQVFIDEIVRNKLIKSIATERGITASNEEIDAQYIMIKNYYGDDFEDAIKAYGYTEESYRDSVEAMVLEQKIKQSMENEVEASDNELVNQINHEIQHKNLNEYKVIIFSSMEEAKEAYDKIEKGTEFSQIAGEYSNLESSNYDGWATLDSISSEIAEACLTIKEGGIAGPFELQSGKFVIFKCVNQIPKNSTISSYSQIPEGYKKTALSAVKQTKASEMFEKILSEKTNMLCTINDMPTELDYAIDLMQYQNENENENKIKSHYLGEDAKNDGLEEEIIKD